MPSFAFWKSSKPDEAKSPLLTDAAVAEELSAIVPGASKKVDLNPGNQDSGVFLFDEDAQEIPGNHTAVLEATSSSPVEYTREQREDPEQHGQDGTPRISVSLLDIDEPSLHPQTPSLVPEQPSATHDDVHEIEPVEEQPSQHEPSSETSTAEPSTPVRPESSQPETSPTERTSTVEPPATAEFEVSETETPSVGQTSGADSPNTTESSQDVETYLPSMSRPASLVPKESGPTLSVEKRSAPALAKIETNMRDRDSGVYMSDHEGSPVSSRPSSIASNDFAPRSRVASLSSKTATASPQRTNSIARLQRPAELNLGFNSTTDPAKPRSELDLRYDLIRNSKTQSKAALRSPTQLLQDRLNMSPKKKDAEEKVRIFTPPRATVNGCMLPGPGAQTEAFTSTSVRAKTEAGGRPAWWCKFDKLVVFDGVERLASGEARLKTRTSKGLSIARRLGDLETVVIPLDCSHCHEMLNRHEWKYDMRVCKRSVCWDCKERCKWELEQEMASAPTPRTDANRERADSMLQDEQSRSSDFAKEIAV